MKKSRNNSRYQARSSFLAVLVAGLALGACGDDPAAPDDEPKVATMRLVVGAQTVNVSEGGVVTGGPIVLATGVDVPVVATFLRANGSPDPLVTSATFRLDVQPGTSAVTFTRTGPFAGTLRGAQSGTTQLSFSLFHLEEGHPDFGPFTVPATVQ